MKQVEQEMSDNADADRGTDATCGGGSSPGGGEAAELLSFRAGGQEYAIDIMSVREIRGWTSATPLPHAPPAVRGVINLRGRVLAILDLSDRLGLGRTGTAERNVVIVVGTGSEGTEHHAGLLVEAVSDILTVPCSALQPPPEAIGDGTRGLVSALVMVDGVMVRILDIDAVLPGGESDAA